MSKFSSPFMAKSPLLRKKIRVKKSYKKGDLVSEDDLDTATGKTVSGQDYSSVRVDEQGPYVVTIGDDKIDTGNE